MVDVVAQVGSLNQFATVMEQIIVADSSASKVAILSHYFSQLQDDQLLHAGRYAAGQAFPMRRRIAQVSEITLITALSVLSRVEPAQLTAQRQQLGDWAEVAAASLVRRSVSLLMLEDVAIALELIGKAKGKHKLSWVMKLLERATALEAKYLIKLLMGDGQISSAEVVEGAIAQMSQQPIERIQWVHLLLGDLGKTALLARYNQLDQARMQLFQPIKFMLASIVQDPVQIIQRLPQGFAVETKFDGIRVQAHIAPADRSINLQQETVIAGMRVALFSRTLQEMTDSFPDLVMPLAALAPHALVTGEAAGLILDGEIVPYQNEQILPFSALQSRLSARTPSSELIASVPVAFIAYDVLYKDGEVLIQQPYLQRRQILESLPMEMPKIRLVSSQQLFDLDQLDQQYGLARSQGQEGLIVKALHSPYRPGQRSQDWLKLRHSIATLDVVVTGAEFAPAPHPRADGASVDSNAASHYCSNYAVAVRASATDATLLNIGKVSVGLDAAEQQELTNWLQAHTLEEFANGNVRLVEPHIVFEVTFDSLRLSSRSKSGYVLEQPRIIRIRRDKPVAQIDTLDTVIHLAELQTGWWDSRM
jgi:DNA ligase-1